MIIISQNKTIILNFDNVNVIAIDKDETKRQIFAKCNNTDIVILGEYATKERTEEVFQEIMLSYTTMELINTRQLQFKETIMGKDLTPCICYEMPEE